MKSTLLIFRVAHIVLAFLLFISSAGVIINKHYCRDELKSMALFLEAEVCHKEKAMKSCPMHSKDRTDEEEEKDCCDNRTEYCKADEDQLAPTFRTAFQLNTNFWPAKLNAYYLELVSIEARTFYYLNYKPPLIVWDLPISLQTLLC